MIRLRSGSLIYVKAGFESGSAPGFFILPALTWMRLGPIGIKVIVLGGGSLILR